MADLVPFTSIDFSNRSWWPQCTVCGKPVDSIQWDTPVDCVWGYHGPTPFYTGEIIITVKCHGEIWTFSNWQGVLTHE